MLGLIKTLLMLSRERLIPYHAVVARVDTTTTVRQQRILLNGRVVGSWCEHVEAQLVVVQEVS